MVLASAVRSFQPVGGVGGNAGAVFGVPREHGDPPVLPASSPQHADNSGNRYNVALSQDLKQSAPEIYNYIRRRYSRQSISEKPQNDTVLAPSLLTSSTKGFHIPEGEGDTVKRAVNVWPVRARC